MIKPHPWIGTLLGSVSALLLPLVTAKPGLAAERLYFSYGVLEDWIAIDSLESYAKTGVPNEDLSRYLQSLTPEQQEQLGSVLTTRVNLSQVAIAQFFYTPIGETLLDIVGEVVQPKSRLPGFYALRASLILAAADPEGLTLLNALRKFPAQGIVIDLARTLEIAGAGEQLVSQTNRAVTAIAQQSAAEVTPLPASRPPDPQLPGSLRWERQTLEILDPKRQRRFPVDLYLPLLTQPKPRPVIVISHGLGSDRQTFAYLAAHLASHGFVVAVPEHPGSSSAQLQALIRGRSNEVIEPQEFIDRPLDIADLLDELQRRSQRSPLRGRLDLQQVGVIGQSFGGYTALALAGAPINQSQLEEDCSRNDDSLNLSLLLQCRVLEVPTNRWKLADPRVKAVIALNPISSSLFGQAGFSQIKAPVMILSSSSDTAAPALSEQIKPFTWLTVPDKYLVLLKGGTHFSVLGRSETEAIPIADTLIGPNPALAQRYLKALSLAFLNTYLDQKPGFKSYLSASYTATLSQPSLPISLVSNLTQGQLDQAIAGNSPGLSPTSP